MKLNRYTKYLALKSLSLATAIIFTVSNATGFAQPFLTTFTESVSLTAPSLSQSLAVPAEFGRISDVYTAPGVGHSNEKLVVYIQDAHSNYDAQKNIQNLLAYLSEHYGIRLIGVEGAIGEVNPAFFDFFDRNETNLAIADRLARKGELSGAELFSFQAPAGTHIAGIEEEVSYREDLKLFKKLIAEYETLEKYFQPFAAALKALRGKFFSRELKRYDDEVRRYTQGQLELYDFVRKIIPLAREHLDLDLNRAASQLEYPYLVRLNYLIKIQNNFQYERFFKEASDLAQAFRALPQNEDSTAVVRMLDHLAHVKSGVDIQGFKSFREFLAALYRLGVQNKIDFYEYSHFRQWAGARLEEEEIRSGELFEDIIRLTEKLYDAMAPEGPARDLVGIQRDFDLADRLLRGEVNRKDHARAVERADSVQPSVLWKRLTGVAAQGNISIPSALEHADKLDELAGLAFRFYDETQKRDRYMVERALAMMQDKKTDRMTVITGGFHRDGMAGLLRDKGISHVVISPRITAVDQTSKSYHQAILDSSQTIFETSKIADVVRLVEDGLRQKLGANLLHDNELTAEAVLTQVVSDVLQLVNQRLAENPALRQSLPELAKAVETSVASMLAETDAQFAKNQGATRLGLRVSVSDGQLQLRTRFTPGIVLFPLSAAYQTPSSQPEDLIAQAASLGSEHQEFERQFKDFIQTALLPAASPDEQLAASIRLSDFFVRNPVSARDILLTIQDPRLHDVILFGIQHSEEVVPVNKVEEARFLVYSLDVFEKIADAPEDLAALKNKFAAIKESYVQMVQRIYAETENLPDKEKNEKRLAAMNQYGEDLQYLVHYKMIDTMHHILFSDRFRSHAEFFKDQFNGMSAFLIEVMNDSKTILYGYYWVRDLAIQLLSNYALTADQKALADVVRESVKDLARKSRLEAADPATHLSKGPSGNEKAHDLTYGANYSLYEIRRKRIRFKLERWAEKASAGTPAGWAVLRRYFQDEITWKQPFIDAVSDLFDAAVRDPKNPELTLKIRNILKALHYMIAPPDGVEPMPRELAMVFIKLIQGAPFVQLHMNNAFRSLLNHDLLLPFANYVLDLYGPELDTAMQDPKVEAQFLRNWEQDIRDAEAGHVEPLLTSINLLTSRFYQDEQMRDKFRQNPNLSRLLAQERPVMTVNAGGSSTMLDLAVGRSVLERFLRADNSTLVREFQSTGDLDKLLNLFYFAYYLPTDDDGGSTRLIKASILKHWGIKISALGDFVQGTLGITKPWMRYVLNVRISLPDQAAETATLESVLTRNDYGKRSVFEMAERMLELPYLGEKFSEDTVALGDRQKEQLTTEEFQNYLRYQVALQRFTDDMRSEDAAAAAGKSDIYQRYIREKRAFDEYQKRILGVARLLDEKLVRTGIVELKDNKIGNLVALGFIVQKEGYAPNFVNTAGVQAGLREYMRVHGLNGLPIPLSYQSNVMEAETRFMRKIGQDFISHTDMIPGDVIVNITSFYPRTEDQIPEAYFLRHAGLSFWGPGSVHSSQGPSFEQTALVEEQLGHKSQGGVSILVMNPFLDDETSAYTGIPDYVDSLMDKIPAAEKSAGVTLGSFFDYVAIHDWSDLIEPETANAEMQEMFLNPLGSELGLSREEMAERIRQIVSNHAVGYYGPLVLDQAAQAYLADHGIPPHRIISGFFLDQVRLSWNRTKTVRTPKLLFDSTSIAYAIHEKLKKTEDGKRLRVRLQQEFDEALERAMSGETAEANEMRSRIAKVRERNGHGPTAQSLGVTEEMVWGLGSVDAASLAQAETAILAALSENPGKTYPQLKAFAENREHPEYQSNIVNFVRKELNRMRPGRSDDEVRKQQQLIRFLGEYGDGSDVEVLKSLFMVYRAFTNDEYRHFSYRTHSYIVDALDRIFKRPGTSELYQEKIVDFLLYVANDTGTTDRKGYYWVRSKIINILASPMPAPWPLHRRQNGVTNVSPWRFSYALKEDGTLRQNVYEGLKHLLTFERPEQIAPSSTNLNEGHSASSVHDLRYAVAFSLYEIRKQRIMGNILRDFTEEKSRWLVDEDKRLLSGDVLRNVAAKYVQKIRAAKTLNPHDRQILFNEAAHEAILEKYGDGQPGSQSPRKRSQLAHALLYLVSDLRQVLDLGQIGNANRDIDLLTSALERGVSRLDHAVAFPLYYLAAYYENVEWDQTFVDAVIYILKDQSLKYVRARDAGEPVRVPDIINQLIYGLQHILKSDDAWRLNKTAFFKMIDLSTFMSSVLNIDGIRMDFMSKVLIPLAEAAWDMHASHLAAAIQSHPDLAPQVDNIMSQLAKNYRQMNSMRALSIDYANGVHNLVEGINALQSAFYTDEFLLRRAIEGRDVRKGLVRDNADLVNQSGGGGTKFLLPLSVNFMQKLIDRFPESFKGLDLEAAKKLLRTAYFLSVDDDGGSTRLIKTAFLKHWGIKVVAPGDFMNAVSNQIAPWMNELIKHRIPANEEEVYENRTLRQVMQEGFPVRVKKTGPGGEMTETIEVINPIEEARKKYQLSHPDGNMQEFDDFLAEIMQVVDTIDSTIIRPANGKAPVLNLSGSSIRNLIYIGFLIDKGGYAPDIVNPRGIEAANRHLAKVFKLNSFPVALSDEANVLYIETDRGNLQVGQDEISHTSKDEGDKVDVTGKFYPAVFDSVNGAHLFTESAVFAFVSSIITSYGPNLEHGDLLAGLRNNRNFRAIILPPNLDEESMLAGDTFRDYMSLITDKLPGEWPLSDYYDVVIIQDWEAVTGDLEALKHLLRNDPEYQATVQQISSPELLKSALTELLRNRLNDHGSGNHGFLQPEDDDISWMTSPRYQGGLGFRREQIIRANLVGEIAKKPHERIRGTFVYSVLYDTGFVEAALISSFDALPAARKNEILQNIRNTLEVNLSEEADRQRIMSAQSLGEGPEIVPLPASPFTEEDLTRELEALYGKGELASVRNFIDFTLLFAGGFFDTRLSSRALDYILRQDNESHDYLLKHPLSVGIFEKENRAASAMPSVTEDILRRIEQNQDKFQILKALLMPQAVFSGNVMLSDLNPDSPFSFANPKTRETIKVLLTEINPKAHFVVLWPKKDASAIAAARAEFAGLNLTIVPFEGKLDAVVHKALTDLYNSSRDDLKASGIKSFNEFLAASTLIGKQDALEQVGLSTNVNRLNSLEGNQALAKYKQQYGSAVEQQVLDFDLILSNAINASRGNFSTLRKQISDDNLVMRQNGIWSLKPDALVLELVSGIVASWAAARQMAQAA